jgi:hypothetical protein
MLKLRLLTMGLVLAATVGAWGCGGSRSSSSTPGGVQFSPVTGTVIPATAGVQLTQTFTVVSGGSPPYTFVATSTPPGLALAAGTVNTGFAGALSATLSGTPTTQGLETFSMAVTDAVQHVTNVSWSVEVQQATPALTVTPSTLPAGVRGTPYTVFLQANGGTNPFAWIVNGNLPPGLFFLPSTGVTFELSGTPTTAGTYPFSVTVTDGSTPIRSAIVNLSVTVP